MDAQTIISCTGHGVARAVLDGGEWHVTTSLTDTTVTCVVGDPVDPNVVYAGTRERGLLRSTDRGETWHERGLQGVVVKSIAVCRADPNVIYAGTKPPGLFVSHDGGETWAERESFRELRKWFWFTPAEPGDPYVMGLAVSPTDPDVVIAGIEYGGMFRSTDGGLTWQGHLRKSSRDCHNLRFHPTDDRWAYQGAGGWPAAFSSDGGLTWKQPVRGLGWSIYGMACAGDPDDPSIMYLSAAPMIVLPNLGKMPRGHWDGHANAFLFRKRGNARWERLGGGLPQPLDHMAYALVTLEGAPGRVWAGLSNGVIWHTADHGDTWRQLPVNLGGVQFSMVVLRA